jgi:hypothetical protein
MKIKHSACAGLWLAAMLAAPARAEVAVIVSAKATNVPASEAICPAYLGKTKQPVPVSMPDKNPLRDEFYSKACHKDPAQVRGVLSKLVFTGNGTLPQEVESDQEMKKLVAADPSKIGYIDKKQADASVKIIATFN